MPLSTLTSPSRRRYICGALIYLHYLVKVQQEVGRRLQRYSVFISVHWHLNNKGITIVHGMAVCGTAVGSMRRLCHLASKLTIGHERASTSVQHGMTSRVRASMEDERRLTDLQDVSIIVGCMPSYVVSASASPDSE